MVNFKIAYCSSCLLMIVVVFDQMKVYRGGFDFTLFLGFLIMILIISLIPGLLVEFIIKPKKSLSAGILGAVIGLISAGVYVKFL